MHQSWDRETEAVFQSQGYQTAQQRTNSEAAAYIETPSLATLINRSRVTENNATLIMFTYLTLLISHVYTVYLYHLLQLAYAARPSLIHILICTCSHSPL